jgi:hypothetical protein
MYANAELTPVTRIKPRLKSAESVGLFGRGNMLVVTVEFGRGYGRARGLSSLNFETDVVVGVLTFPYPYEGGRVAHSFFMVTVSLLADSTSQFNAAPSMLKASASCFGTVVRYCARSSPVCPRTYKPRRSSSPYLAGSAVFLLFRFSERSVWASPARPARRAGRRGGYAHTDLTRGVFIFCFL